MKIEYATEEAPRGIRVGGMEPGTVFRDNESAWLVVDSQHYSVALRSGPDYGVHAVVVVCLESGLMSRYGADAKVPAADVWSPDSVTLTLGGNRG